jgi:hypothetical protein
MKTRRSSWQLVLAATIALAAVWPVRSARAQSEIRAASVTKLQVLSPEVVPQNRLELGVLWEMGWYKRLWDDKGRIVNPRVVSTAAELAFRLVFGVFEQKEYGVELGLLLPVAFQWSKDRNTGDRMSANGMGNVPFGLKFRFLNDRKASMAWLMNVTVPTGDEASGLSHGFTSLATGFAFSSQPTGSLSIDVNITSGVTLGIDPEDKDDVPRWGLGSSVGLAWILPKDAASLMPCLELAYHMNHTPGADDPFAHKLVMNVGLNYQLNRRVIIMQAAQLDLAGANAMRGAMWFMSFMFLT